MRQSITDVQASLFSSAYPYYKESVEARGIGLWDFNNDGNVNALDFSIYEIALMLYEDIEARQELLEQFNVNFSATIECAGGSFVWNNITTEEKKSIIEDILAKQGSKQSPIGFLGKNKRPKSVEASTTRLSPSSFDDGTGNILTDVLPIFVKRNSNNLTIRKWIEDVNITVSSSNIGKPTAEGADILRKILVDQILVQYSKPRTKINDFYELSDADANYFPLCKPSQLSTESRIDIYSFNLVCEPLFGSDSLNYSINDHYKENFIFKTTDTFSERVEKFKKYAEILYTESSEFGVVDYTAFLNDVTKIPFPAGHATYVAATIDDEAIGTAIAEGYALDVNNNATKFLAHLDIPYFRHNIENILIPRIRKAVTEVIQLAIDKGTTDITSIRSIDFSSKEVADLTSAICDGNIEYIQIKYGITDAEVNSFEFEFTANNAGPTRYYSDRKIIDKPVWKLIRCHTHEEYYAYENEFFDYSISGLFHLSNIQSADPSTPIPASENLFLNQNVSGVFAGVYHLFNYTQDQLGRNYTDNFYQQGPFNKAWNEVKDNASLYFYDHATTDDEGNEIPHIPEGCYKIYLGIYPVLGDGVTKDESRILSYQAMPHYWEDADCSKPPCYVPPSATQTPSMTITPSVTQTPSLSATPTQTSTYTPTQTQTQTLTKTSTQTQTVTKTQTQTQSPSKTPTRTPSHTPSQTKTCTPSLTQDSTPSTTASVTTTRTQTRTPSTTRTIVPPRECLDSSNLAPIGTSTQTPTPSKTKTQTPTKPPCTHSQTPTQTPSNTPRPSSSNTPTMTTTLSLTPSQTKTCTPTPSKGFEYDQGIDSITES